MLLRVLNSLSDVLSARRGGVTMICSPRIISTRADATERAKTRGDTKGGGVAMASSMKGNAVIIQHV